MWREHWCLVEALVVALKLKNNFHWTADRIWNPWYRQYTANQRADQAFWLWTNLPNAVQTWELTWMRLALSPMETITGRPRKSTTCSKYWTSSGCGWLFSSSKYSKTLGCWIRISLHSLSRMSLGLGWLWPNRTKLDGKQQTVKFEWLSYADSGKFSR